jgi:UDPglucose 6-dehydrogenase
MGIGIVGSEGFVGRAQHELFPDAEVYDAPKGIGTRALINACEITFVAVPTPNLAEGKLNTSIVEEVVGWCESDIIVLRSTVNPGDSDRLAEQYNKKIVVQPEFMGESPNHPFNDHKERPWIVLGGKSEDRRKVIESYQEVYNANIDIRQITRLEAEVAKLSENRAIAYKVAQCQELYDACEAAGVDYYTIRDTVYGDDPRFDLWFSFIYPDKRGMNSSCIPKDVIAWTVWAESLGLNPKVTKAILEKNKEWLALNVKRDYPLKAA